MKTKSQHIFKKEIIHLNESHQLKQVTGVTLKALVSKVSLIFLIKRLSRLGLKIQRYKVPHQGITVQGKKE